MSYRVLNAAAMAVLLGASSVLAQTVGSVGGPSEMPPAGFKGQQFVDSRGCVYLKAGLSGQTNWVLRVGRDRKPMCNQTPSFGPRPKIEIATAEEAAMPAAPEVVMAEPTPMAATAPVVVRETVRPVVTAAAAPLAILDVPVAATRPRTSGGYEAESGGTGSRRIGCYSSAPVAERVKLRSGGTAVVCTRGDGTLTGWRPPVYADGAGVGAALSEPTGSMMAGGSRQTGHSAGGYAHDHDEGSDAAGMLADSGAVMVPQGYKQAWDDGRLNPMRGKGTARGWADQDQVWTRDVPAKLVTDAAPTERRVKKRVAGSASTTEPAATRKVVSTKSVGGTGRTYIQVGTFGVASNADGAASRLSALGLPVARAKFNKGGKALQIVMAGPFSSAADAHSVLSSVRGAGFGDAFVK